MNLGLSENALKRWYDGDTSAYNIEALIRIFDLASLSMDQLFGLKSAEGTTIPDSDTLHMLELERKRSARYEKLLDRLLSGDISDAELSAQRAAVTPIDNARTKAHSTVNDLLDRHMPETKDPANDTKDRKSS